MVMSFALRRTYQEGTGNERVEYLFLPLEADELVPEDMPINPVIPGSTYANIFGTTSPNFILDLGSKALTVRASGNLIDVAAGDYPGNLTGTNRYILGSANIPGYGGGSLVTTSTTATAQTAKQLRAAVLDYWVSQSSSDYTDHMLCYPEFCDSSSETIVTGVSTTLFKGILRTPRFSRQNGVENQYPVTLVWRVGESD